MIVLITVLSFVLVIAVVKVYKNGHQILRATAMARCKWHNRGYKASMPREDGNLTDKYAFKGIKIDNTDDEEINIELHVVDDDDERDESDDEIGNVSLEVDMEKADTLITNSLAKSLIKREGEMVCTDGSEKVLIEVGTLGKYFDSGDRVDINSLKEKGIVSSDAAYVKIIGGGMIDKPLMVYANDFSLSAVKMIALSGGQAIKIFTFKGRS